MRPLEKPSRATDLVLTFRGAGDRPFSLRIYTRRRAVVFLTESALGCRYAITPEVANLPKKRIFK